MQKNDLIASHKVLVKNMGYALIIISVIFLLPLFTVLMHPIQWVDVKWFLLTFMITGILGAILARTKVENKASKMSIGQDAVFVILIWFFVSILSTIPFIGGLKMTFVHSLFESISGWTTTGLSVVDVEAIPKIYLLYRSIMQFFGGVGLVLILVSALSATFGLRLYHSEGRYDRLLPNLLNSSRLILTIYMGYFIAGSIIYTILGMTPFNAVNHAMAALSTGGFSTHASSIGYYNSVAIEGFTIVLMILGTTNFSFHLLLLSGKFNKLARIGELRFFLFLIAFAVPYLIFTLSQNIYGHLSEVARMAIFQVVSAISTTGFQTTDISVWPLGSIFTIVVLMIIGGGVNSTAGGIKYSRVYLMTKSFAWSLKDRFKSKNVIREHYIIKTSEKEYIQEEQVNEHFNFAFIYILVMLIGVIFISNFGYSLEGAFFEFSSALGTVGLSLGLTSAQTPNAVLIVQMIGMFLGRLEIIVVFTGFIRLKRDLFSRIKLR